MNHLTILIFSGLFVITGISAQSLQNPSLSPKRHTTFIIDSIPTAIPKTYQLSGINTGTNNYKLFFGASPFSEYPTFGIHRARPLLIMYTAFTHESLFESKENNPLPYQSWDNFEGTNSLTGEILWVSFRLISGFLSQ